MSLPLWPSRRSQDNLAFTLQTFREVVGIPWSLYLVAEKERQQKAIESCDNHWCRGPELCSDRTCSMRHGQHCQCDVQRFRMSRLSVMFVRWRLLRP